MEVDIETLKIATNRLLQFVQEIEGEKVEVPHDYYWAIVQDQVYDPYTDPTDFTIGQLSDDWREIQRFVDDKEEPIKYYLVWLASILKAIGEK